MTEKKQIVHGLRLHYSGPFSVEEFYAEVEDWMEKKHLHKEIKRKSEHIVKNSKKGDWMIEAWKSFDHFEKEMIQIHATMHDLKERSVIRNKKTVKFQYAEVYIEINGYIESEYTYQWTQAPIYYFVKSLYDKYIWPILDKYDGAVYGDCYDLHKRLKAYFELYRMRVG